MQEQDSIATRQSLLARLKDVEDQESWRDFFDTYWELIYRVAIKCGLSDADAQDVVQETVLSVARKIEGFVYDPEVCSFRTWMLRLTRWRVTDRLRRRQRIESRLAPALDESLEDSGFDWDTYWETEWKEHLLRVAMARVRTRTNLKDVQIYELAANKGWSTIKIANSLKINRGQVYLAKHRVAKLLKKELGKLAETEI